MEKRRIFIFRISKGNESRNPIGSCPMDYSEIKSKISKLKKTDLKVITYEKSHLDFIKSELWANGTLRQGWGINNTDLRVPTKKWIENYMYNGKIYWNDDISCNQAKGRHNIINRMQEISKGDILLIPKTSKDNINDYQKFVACEVADTYYFDLPKKPKDFGHCISVKEIKEFTYSNSTLWRSDFGPPYICAVLEVKKHHSKYNKFLKFVDIEF